MRRLFLALLFGAWCMSATPETLAARSWYIDNESAGANTGQSWSDAWRGFSDIDWAVVNPGDVLFISGGTESRSYGETLHVAREGTPESPIIVRPGVDPGHNGKVVIEGGGERQYGVRLASYTHLHGGNELSPRLHIRNATVACVYGFRAVGIKLQNVEVSESAMDGIYLRSPDLGSMIIDCIVRDNGRDGYRSLANDPSETRIIIARSVFLRNNADGLTFDSGHVVSGCYIANNLGGTSSDGIEGTGHNNQMYNNIVLDVGGVGIINKTQPEYAQASNILIFNNVIFQTEANRELAMRGIAVSSTPSAELKNILVANNTIVDLKFLGLLINVGQVDQVEVVNNLLFNVNYGVGVRYDNRVDYAGGDFVFDYNLLPVGTSGQSVQWNGTRYSNDGLAQAGLGQLHGSGASPAFLAYTPMLNRKESFYVQSANLPGKSLESWADRFSLPALRQDIDGWNHTGLTGWTVGALAPLGSPLEVRWDTISSQPVLRGIIPATPQFYLEKSSDLTDWALLQEGEATSPTVFVVKDPDGSSEPAAFYRIRRELP